MNISTSPAAAPAAPTAPSAAEREVQFTSYVLAAALLLGVVLQVWIPPGPLTLVAGAALAGAVAIAVAYLSPGRVRDTLAGFRFIATLLFVLAVFAVLGTLVLQGKPTSFYVDRYGAVGKLIVALRVDDVFHGLPFALVMALFGTSVIASSTRRWPVKARNAGFFICHVGLITSLAGAAASSALSLRGRIDLHAGGETTQHVRLTKGGMPTGEYANLGFDLRLDKFDAPSYESEFRVGYYEQVVVQDEHGTHQQWKLKASFEPDLQKHRLPNGDSFRLTGVYPDFRPVPDAATKQVVYGTASQEWRNPAVNLEVQQQGLPKQQLMMASRPQAVFLSPTRALVFEKRADEKRAYISWVTAREGTAEQRAVISVNDPMEYAGWTLYQVNYNPEDPTYSGFEAVYDPGVAWVFLGFALICLGVFYMFYVEPRLKQAKKKAPAAAAA